MKLEPETITGAEAAARFETVVRKVLSVSHDEIMRREDAYQREAAKNPHRRGPKRKAK